jgi:membrane-bound serine protease (ClpP class)
MVPGMKKIFLHIILLFTWPMVTTAQNAISITIDGAINPVAAGYIQEAIAKAQSEKAECLLIHLNTPGGLLTSTRIIVSDILQSPVPVIIYVAPGGAHAGSAGVFITLAAHIAAMAPGTNIGAAHPVSLQGGMDSIMGEKVTNDAAAFIRSIAGKRKRNTEWAEAAVRNSIAISETEAKAKNVVDFIAGSDRDLLEQADGKQVELPAGTITLHTRGLVIQQYSMGWIEKILNIVSDPNITYILMLLGFFGILFELYNPGAILPGIVGVISIILSFYSLQSLPVNYAGLALVAFAIALFLLEIKIVSHGMLAIGGIVSLLMGSLMLMHSGPSLEYARISRVLIISCTAITALFFLLVLGTGIRAQQRRVVTGIEGLIGQTGTTLDTLNPEGRVRLLGETWNAISTGSEISKGSRVRVTEMKQLKLYVEPIDNL